MSTAYLTVTLIAVAADGFSGIAALLHMQAIVPGMAKAGVPVSWLTFPIGTLKTAGALGLAAGPVLRVRHLHPHPCQRLQPAVLPRERVPGAQRRSPCPGAAREQPQRVRSRAELTAFSTTQGGS
jgi:hypothetical protein